jgi:hypothetical protein
MTDVERQYHYEYKWPHLVLYAGIWILFAVFCSYQALQPGPAIQSVVCWVSCTLSVILLGKIGLLIVCRCFFLHRVAFTKTSLLVPKADWSSKEVSIDYQAITALTLRDSARFLFVTHRGGKYRIDALKFPTRAAFREVCELLAVRAPWYSKGHAEPGAVPDRST